jgi:hypothetical protein
MNENLNLDLLKHDVEKEHYPPIEKELIHVKR